ncbi:hypothetical protein [Haloarcula marina]|uniref:hypothetical protein n=1 Tax=Haloarcula marina TaxID=2961574 RepID=UPI0020B65C80|nr:hypothetical protein [Halomicroarcula marina]
MEIPADVPVHEDTDTVDAKRFEQVAEMDDAAPVGVTNADGHVLLMQVTDTCDWKIPMAAVGADEDYVAEARAWVETNAGIEVDIEGVEGVWRYEARLEGGDGTAEREFVVFSASTADPSPAVPGADGGAHAAAWVSELPDDAALVPGTRLFVE